MRELEGVLIGGRFLTSVSSATFIENNIGELLFVQQADQSKGYRWDSAGWFGIVLFEPQFGSVRTTDDIFILCKIFKRKN